MDVPVQFFQSVIAIELAVTGALLFQIRWFEPRELVEREGLARHGPWTRLFMAVVIGGTVFGSLYAIASGGQRSAAIAVSVGVAITVLPILLRALPPLTPLRADAAATVTGVFAYALVVVILVVLLNG